MHISFENWLKQQDCYTNLRFSHGNALFFRDGNVYRILVVQLAYLAYCQNTANQRVLEHGSNYDFRCAQLHFVKAELLADFNVEQPKPQKLRGFIIEQFSQAKQKINFDLKPIDYVLCFLGSILFLLLIDFCKPDLIQKILAYFS